jgi:hypothetical protein
MGLLGRIPQSWSLGGVVVSVVDLISHIRSDTTVVEAQDNISLKLAVASIAAIHLATLIGKRFALQVDVDTGV